MTELRAVGTRHRPGFLDGAASLPRAVRELLGSPGLWPHALAPVGAFALLFAGASGFAVTAVRPWVLAHLPAASSSVGRLAVGAAGWGAVGLFVFCGWYVALALAPTLSSPALERLVRAVEERAGAPARQPLGFWQELGCGLRAFSLAGALWLAGTTLIFAVNLAVPAATPVTLPLGLLGSSLLVAWSLFDYPLTLRGFGLRARVALMQRNFGCVLGFGAAFALLFWLPCAGVLLLPVGAVAATRLACELLFDSDAENGAR